MTVSGAVLDSARWRRLVPIAFVTSSFAYLDRSDYSIGAAGGLADRLHISAARSGLLGGLSFIGYFLFQVPAGDFAERRSVEKPLFWSLIAWGRERGRADTLLVLGNPVTLLWMSAVSGYLVAAVGYRGMFVIEGLTAGQRTLPQPRGAAGPGRPARWPPSPTRSPSWRCSGSRQPRTARRGVVSSSGCRCWSRRSAPRCPASPAARASPSRSSCWSSRPPACTRPTAPTSRTSPSSSPPRTPHRPSA